MRDCSMWMYCCMVELADGGDPVVRAFVIVFFIEVSFHDVVELLLLADVAVGVVVAAHLRMFTVLLGDREWCGIL